MSEEYNGWKNYETWNIALWINNDEGLYLMAKDFKGDYGGLREYLREAGMIETPDKVSFSDSALDVEALDSMLMED